MKCLRNSVLLVVLASLLACGQRRNTQGPSRQTPAPSRAETVTLPNPPPVGPKEIKSFEVISTVVFDGEPLTVDSIAQVTEGQNQQNIREFSKVLYRGKTGYLDRQATITNKDGKKMIRLIARPYYSLGWGNMQNASAIDFITAKNFAHVNKRSRARIDLRIVYERESVNFHLWTYRCKTAREYKSVASEFPLIHNDLLFSVPSLFAIDAFTKTRLTTIELNIMSKELASFPSKILISTAESSHDNGKAMYGTSLAGDTEYLDGDVNLYNPSPIYEFFEMCSSFYFGTYGPQQTTAQYAPYYPTRNISAEKDLGKQPIFLWGERFLHLLKSRLQPIEAPDLSIIPSNENLSPSDRAYLNTNGFSIPNTKEFL